MESFSLAARIDDLRRLADAVVERQDERERRAPGSKGCTQGVLDALLYWSPRCSLAAAIDLETRIDDLQRTFHELIKGNAGISRKRPLTLRSRVSRSANLVRSPI